MLVSGAYSALGQKSALLRLTERGSGEWELAFSLGDCQVATAGEGDAVVEAAGMESMARREGQPALPVLCRLLMVPCGAEVEVAEVEVGRELKLPLSEGQRLQPWQGARVKEEGDRPAVVASKEAYSGVRSWSAGEVVEVERLGVMGRQQVVRVRVNPAVYNAAVGEVRVATRVKARLKVKGAAEDAEADRGAEGYLVVSRPAFREGLQPFVRWKRQQGYEVREVYVDTAARDSVKAAIGCHFRGEAAQWPRYVLLVGNIQQLHTYYGTTAPTGLMATITDLYYAEHTGDYLPDAMLGRWPVADTAQLRAVVEKTLRYERGEDIDTSWLKRLLLVAGYENGAPAPVTTNGQVNYVAREARRERPQLDTLCWHNPASRQQRGEILEAIGQGAALVNYTAHCRAGGWTSPAVSFASVDTLDSRQPMLYVNNCCESNNFSSNCFGEQLLRKAVGGAVGVVGATNSTLWNEDYYWSVGPKYPFSTDPLYDASRPGAFDRWLGRTGGVATVGELLWAGNLAVSAFGSPYDKFYWEIYCLLGDPSLMPYVGVPQELALSLESEARAGVAELTVVATEGAKVAAMQGDSLLAVGIVPVGGRLTLPLEQSLVEGELLLTATASGYWPRVDTVAVAAAARAVAIDSVVVGDSTLSFRLTNCGQAMLRGVSVVWQQDSTEVELGTEVVYDTATIDSLPAGGRARVAMRQRGMVAGQSPVVGGRLVVADTAWLGQLRVARHKEATYPSWHWQLRAADSSLASNVVAGGSYLLQVEAVGQWDSLLVEVAGRAVRIGAGESEQWIPFAVGSGERSVAIEGRLCWGHWVQEQKGVLLVGGSGDGFERGMECFAWQTAGTQPWRVDSTVSHNGRQSLRSGSIDYRQTSALALEVALSQAGRVDFYAKTSCEEEYDMLTFSVDGSVRWRGWGETDWTQVGVELAAGRHTLRWVYVKDETGTEGEDCVWIDDVEIAGAVWDSAYGCDGGSGLGVFSAAAAEALDLYPNPTDGRVSLSVGEAYWGGELRVADVYGRVVHRQSVGFEPQMQIDLGGLGRGVYLLTIEKGGRSASGRLLLFPR